MSTVQYQCRWGAIQATEDALDQVSVDEVIQGMLLEMVETALDGRSVNHGAYFDAMMCLAGSDERNRTKIRTVRQAYDQASLKEALLWLLDGGDVSQRLQTVVSREGT